MSVNAFITGSYAYGEPKPDSDIDLVIFLDEGSIQKLADVCGIDTPYGCESMTFRFAELNLIAFSSERAFEAWREGTEVLVKRAALGGTPVKRDDAVATIQAFLRGETPAA